MTFYVYTGDGNDGTSFDHEIEATDLNGAVKVYMRGVSATSREIRSASVTPSVTASGDMIPRSCA